MDNQEQSSGLPNELELLKQRARLIGVEFSNNIGVDTLRERVNAKLEEMDDDASADAATKQSEEFDEDVEEEPVQEGEETNGLDAAAQLAAMKASAPATTTVIQEIPKIETVEKVVAPGESTQVINPIEPFAPRAVDPGVSTKLGQPSEVKEGRRLSLRQYLYNEQMKLVRVQITNLDPKKADLHGEMLAVANKYLGTVKKFIPYGEQTDDGWHIPFILYKELERRRFLHIRTVKDKRTGQLRVQKSWAKEFSITILPPLSQKELAQLATAQAAAGSIDNMNETL